MQVPGSVAVTVWEPVAPAVACGASDDEARASLAAPTGAAASHRWVMPSGPASVPSALTAAKWTSMALSTVVVIWGR